MKKIVSVLLAMVMLIAVPCLAFDGYQGHEGQIPLCQNNKTGALRFAPMKDIDSTTGVNYEPFCNTRYFSGTTTPTETLIWINIQGIQGPQGIQGIQGEKGDKGDQGLQGVQGLQGIQGIKGDKGDQGIQGIQGPPGQGGVIDYEPLRGEINYNLLPNATEYTFIEPHATITVTPTQKLIGLIGAELGYDGSGNGTAYFNVGICYRANGSTDPLTPIVFYSTSNEYGIKDFYWASVKDAILGEGSWDVGYCIMNYGAYTLVNHLGGPSTSLSGWLMVVE